MNTVKTLIRVQGESKSERKIHAGTAAITITLETRKDPPEIVMEYYGSVPMLITMVGDLLLYIDQQSPGVSKNAIMNYLKASGQLSEDGKSAHIQYKKPNGKEEAKRG